MVLDGHVEGVPVKFHDLHSFVLGVVANEFHSGRFELLDKVGVDFIAMPVTFFN